MHNSGFVNQSHEQIISFLIFFHWCLKFYDFRISFATLWLRASYCKDRLINISPPLALGIYDQFTIIGWVDKTWLNLKQSYRIMRLVFWRILLVYEPKQLRQSCVCKVSRAIWQIFKVIDFSTSNTFPNLMAYHPIVWNALTQ